MKDNVVYFSWYISRDLQKEKIDRILRVINGSLKSLEKIQHTNISYDILFFLDAPKDIFSELSSKFKWINFIEFNNSDFPECHLVYHKWFNLSYFKNSQYRQILYLDSDVYFSNDLNIVFKYAEQSNSVLTCLYRSPETMLKLAGDEGLKSTIIYNGRPTSLVAMLNPYPRINAGQLLFKSWHVNTISDNLTKRFMHHIKNYRDNLKDLINRGIADKFYEKVYDWTTDEIAGKAMLYDFGISIDAFDSRIAEINTKSKKENPSIITHYLGSGNDLDKILGKDNAI